jgi:hypothetical protein
MRILSETLIAAQKQSSSVPFVKVEAVNKVGGVVRADWTRLYEGGEDVYHHAVTMAGDGSLLRIRLTLAADSRKIYRQRTVNPGQGRNFSQWEYTGQYNAVVVAAASLGTEVSIIWVKTNKEIRRLKSTDYGINWTGAELVDYTVTMSANGLAAAYKPGSDLAIFFIDQETLYVKRQINGQWQTKVSWGKTTGVLTGVAAVYDGDWNLLVTGKDTAGNYKMWILIYGDGGSIPAGSWSELKEVATAPAAGQFEYRQPFIDKPDVFRCSFVEKYTGTQSYNRPYLANSIPSMAFGEGLWREAEPFNLSTEYGLAMAHYGDDAWLSTPDGVWKASLRAASVDLTPDLVGVRQPTDGISGTIAIELKNEEGKYAKPGENELVVLDRGCQITLGVGFVTTAGKEYSPGSAFRLEAYEQTNRNGLASLVLHARDGWKALNDWRARQQLRWNKTGDETNVLDIMGFVFAKAGLKMEVKSQSGTITGFYPDFTIRPGERGKEAIAKLLSFVPDVVFIEGDSAYVVYPQSTDISIYGYGIDHMIFEGKYRHAAMVINRIQMEGCDDGGGVILEDTFDWEEIGRGGERFVQISDRNLNTLEKTEQRTEAVLRQTEIEAEMGEILVPVNCGQQMFDVIEITDKTAGMEAVKKRVTGIMLVYRPSRGEYRQRLVLGRV